MVGGTSSAALAGTPAIQMARLQRSTRSSRHPAAAGRMGAKAVAATDARTTGASSHGTRRFAAAAPGMAVAKW